jgi:hypothetical protein
MEIGRKFVKKSSRKQEAINNSDPIQKKEGSQNVILLQKDFKTKVNATHDKVNTSHASLKPK